MIGRYNRLLAASFIALLITTPVFAQDEETEEMIESWQNLSERVNNETFVWFEKKLTPEQLNAFGSQVAKEMKLATTDNNRGFSVFEESERRRHQRTIRRDKGIRPKGPGLGRRGRNSGRAE